MLDAFDDHLETKSGSVVVGGGVTHLGAVGLPFPISVGDSDFTIL